MEPEIEEMLQRYEQLASRRLAWLVVTFSVAFFLACALFLVGSMAVFVYW